MTYFNDKLDFTDEASGLTTENVGSKGTGIAKEVLNDRATFFNSIASLVSGKKVLDVGCNNGRWMSWLLDQNASHVVGIDSDSSVIGVANTNLQKYFATSKYTLAISKWEDYSAPSDIDIVFCAGIIHVGITQSTLITKLASFGNKLILEGPVCTSDDSVERTNPDSGVGDWDAKTKVPTIDNIKSYLDGSYSSLTWKNPSSYSSNWAGNILVTADV